MIGSESLRMPRICQPTFPRRSRTLVSAIAERHPRDGLVYVRRLDTHEILVKKIPKQPRRVNSGKVHTGTRNRVRPFADSAINEQNNPAKADQPKKAGRDIIRFDHCVANAHSSHQRLQHTVRRS